MQKIRDRKQIQGSDIALFFISFFIIALIWIVCYFYQDNYCRTVSQARNPELRVYGSWLGECRYYRGNHCLSGIELDEVK